MTRLRPVGWRDRALSRRISAQGAETGYSAFDPIFALAIGFWLLGSTVQELRDSGEALLWPEDATCPHSDGDEASPPSAVKRIRRRWNRAISARCPMLTQVVWRSSRSSSA
jgi:hypothetical protein